MAESSNQRRYSVVNGKLMRATSTARIEILPTESAKLLNNLEAALDGLCSWLLHRFGPDSPEGHEATVRLERHERLGVTSGVTAGSGVGTLAIPADETTPNKGESK